MKDTSISVADRLSPLAAVTIVFLSNFCILVIELVAGRLMAPIVGVSLYTWTSIIGVILAGISLGNYAGGKIADRWASRMTLAWLFVLSAAGSVSILLTVLGVYRLRDLEVPTFVGIVLVFSCVFLLPATILGTISPVVVKLTLNDLSQTGNVVGKIYAAGAVGSIFGTFATGFFLISMFGTRQLIWMVAGGLLLIGAIIGLSAKNRWRYAPGITLILFFGLTAVVGQRGFLNSSCYQETDYFCIKVRIDDENPDVRVLVLDRLVHSYVDLTDPTSLRYGYEQIYANVLQQVFPDTPPVSALFIGGGGYTFPRYIEETHPNSLIDVIEIDPGVTQVAFAELGVPEDTIIRSINQDARGAISQLPASTRYNLIIGDAFNDYSVPYHLTTLEFNRLVADHLTDDGIYMVNIIDGRDGGFLRAYVHTLSQEFEHVYVASLDGNLGDEKARQTYVIVASQNQIDQEMNSTDLSTYFVSPEVWQDYLTQGQAILLTDDYVPVDNLLAPVFADSGF